MADIIIFGQAKFGCEVFTRLLAHGHRIVAVSVPPQARPGRLDPLQQAALDHDVRIVQRKSYKSDEAAAEVGAGDADLCVLAYVTQIIPRRILDAPAHASICFHPSLLPAYRGGSAIPWQLIHGETSGGVTVFRPDDGIDTGPVYVRKQLKIGPDESAASYYYGHVFEVGVEATIEAADMALRGSEPVAQDENLASYQPLCRDEHAGVDWNAGVQTVHNLVRGCDPSPGAYTHAAGEKVRLYGSRILAERDSGARCGEVLGVDDEGINVAAAGGTLRFSKLADSAGKAAAAEVAGRLQLAPGTQLA